MIRDDKTLMDLTGVNASQLKLKIYNASKVQIGLGTGTFEVLNAYPGIVRYKPNAADSATTGDNAVRVEVDFNGTDPDMSDYMAWKVDP
jgi:hypothetical protein